jgi:hypothetical protein
MIFFTSSVSPIHPWPGTQRTTGFLKVSLYPVMSDNPLGSVSNTERKLVGNLKVTILAVSADADTFQPP